MSNSTVTEEGQNSQAVLNQIVLEYMREQNRQRKWRWVKRALILILIIWIIFSIMMHQREEIESKNSPHVGVIDIRGKIFEGEDGSADSFSKSLKQAYNSKNMKALIIRIDSPGGSPVQADYMYITLQHYRKKYPSVKTYAVCVDMCASAAYYVAAAADEIYANPASLVGSIGVVYNGFGFVDTMQKLGVSRRLQTAGKNKGFMDEFSPVSPLQEQKLQAMLDIIHQQFIAKVKAGRGARLIIDDETFSGLFWTGEQAKEKGLIDGFASSGALARDVIKIEKIINYTDKPNFMGRVSKQLGMAMTNQWPMGFDLRSSIQGLQLL